MGCPLLADPARSPFRIYRDVRFSKDKSPYKTGAGRAVPVGSPARAAGAPRPGRTQAWRGLAGGYFHLEPGSIFVGGGMWHPDRAVLAAFRERVDRDPGSVLAAIEDERFRAVFGSVSGESLARNPRGYPADHPHGELLRLKDVIFSRRLSDARRLHPGAARPHRRAISTASSPRCCSAAAARRALAPGANDAG